MNNFLQLHGADRVISQLTQFSRFKPKVHRAVSRSQKPFETMAKDHVTREVYSKTPNPRYPRSRNLLAATFAKRDKDSTADDEILVIGLDPLKASRPFAYVYRNGVNPSGILSYSFLNSSKGDFDYYPSYVRRGILFRQKVGARDFMAAIRGDAVPKFTKLVAEAVRDF